MNSCQKTVREPVVSMRVRWVQCLGVMALVVATGSLNWTSDAFAVRPFVTDDARIVYKGQLEVESFAGVALANGKSPVVEARSIQGMSLTDRFEVIAGGFGFTYQDGQARPLDIAHPAEVRHPPIVRDHPINIGRCGIALSAQRKQAALGFVYDGAHQLVSLYARE